MRFLEKLKRFSFKGFLRLTRFPNLLMIGLTQYLCAIFLVPQHGNRLSAFLDINLLLLSSSTIIIAAAGYIINDYYDIKIDYVNKPERVIVGKVIKRRVVIIAHTSFNIIGILIGLYLGKMIAAINVVSIFLLWIYSNQLKRKPFVGNFIVSLLTGMSIFIVAVYYRSSYFIIGWYAIFAFSISLIREIIKDMEDLKGDERYGSKTLPIIWGIPNTKILLYILIFLFIILQIYFSGIINNYILNNFFVILAIPIIYFVYLIYKADTPKRFRRISAYCKLLMLAGIISISFF